MYTLTQISRVVCVVVCLILFSSPASSTQLSNGAVAPNLPFNFTYVFTAQLNLGTPSKPIPIPGGVRLIEPILNGTVSGPAINATIGYSLATPTATNNATVQAPTINAVGTTSDGFPVYIYETGIGSPSGQVTRIVGFCACRFLFLAAD